MNLKESRDGVHGSVWREERHGRTFVIKKSLKNKNIMNNNNTKYQLCSRKYAKELPALLYNSHRSSLLIYGHWL